MKILLDGLAELARIGVKGLLAICALVVFVLIMVPESRTIGAKPQPTQRVTWDWLLQQSNVPPGTYEIVKP